ncbi:glutathione S-transferase family protein [Paremcibacter congregatus]|uniref:Glutathione S-transferase n=1 Tax=Paremcibacter congregatus TaxID=2043170 RepID=A0A2G4YWG7_9PROT|nr:glutathione S-transferase family protein [Paremcibacter congregatus]PHZ86684.1 glutathione S-transferase [Paremcibacter congregatus]QDE26299.1 glutathione S-transferase family protein [Paremcibacter congregatus]
MYQLFYLQGACSLATQVILRELGQEVEIIDKQHIHKFKEINPIETVPVLRDGDNTLVEGAAIMLHILNKHENSLLPKNGTARQKAIQDIMFANATMHPAYGKLFFIAQHITDETAKKAAFTAAAKNITHLWQVIENVLKNKPFLGGSTPSAADIMLTVYARWGASFPVDITLGKKTTTLLNAVQAMPNFKKSVKAEQAESEK